MRPHLVLLALVCVGCSGGGRLVQKPADELRPSGDGPQGVIELPAGENGQPGTNEPSKPPTGVASIAISYEPGRKETYILTNQTVTQTRGQTDGPIQTTESFFNAKQEVSVIKSGEVRIRTYDVSGGVRGDSFEEKQADNLVKNLAKAVEGSMLQGKFTPDGRGENLFLLGDGVGLNPMGPQAGAQDVMVGFMGVLLPPKAAKVGDTWSGTYDITASAQDLFGNAGAMVEDGDVPITYELLDFDAETNYVKLSLTSKGKPLVKIPIGGGLAKIQMSVESKGQALVRFNDGWLQELRLETTIVTEGFVATKQVVKTITRRQK